MEEKRSNSIKVFLYISAWVIIWGTFGSLWFNFGAICLCLILTFIPIKIIHPFRVKELRNSSIMMVGVWSISAFFLILHKHSFLLHQFHAMIFGLWLVSTAYFVWISLRRSFKQNTWLRAHLTQIFFEPLFRFFWNFLSFKKITRVCRVSNLD